MYPEIQVLWITKNIWNRSTFLSFEIDVAFTLNDIDLQITLTFDQALVE